MFLNALLGFFMYSSYKTSVLHAVCMFREGLADAQGQPTRSVARGPQGLTLLESCSWEKVGCANVRGAGTLAG